MRRNRDIVDDLLIFFGVFLFAILLSALILEVIEPSKADAVQEDDRALTAMWGQVVDKKAGERKIELTKRVLEARSAYATVTAYNTVAWQTDSTPCIAAAGYICGRTDVAACPSSLALHTWVQIDGKKYECMDRTAAKFNGRYDISFDKDIQGARNFGKRQLKVVVL